ncbi:hypothetical protein TBLA_0C04700 [Henningerozyma blattae CBS 6284]|uniref:Actin-related protein 2/3 complex subunit 5 n=1 Tax=Henningerozyma blattae (strain ATCC 34711 / CBS 6284 / DSM 70876 / NBRC 10599 / NRRL Y-10934 / UCD 77-7) TaxID=1071380 RepID=I2H1L4_HENB6|nr:hypothetical protein TBLA_0C04700 [Tetrapisispora blattae CBS 6284]CCH60266.1 hypothetical protein TBLA_0C04700 [Tetrapisispora blattae CBS 6284]
MDQDWRRIDIDAFDPESGRLTEKDLIPPYPNNVTLQDIEPTINQLRNLASSGDSISAIKLATSDPPYSGDENVKYQYFLAVMTALSQVKQSDITNIIKQLSPKQQDVLIKYLYKGMAVKETQKQGGVLLAWFEKLTQVAGINPVVHYINDRKTV